MTAPSSVSRPNRLVGQPIRRIEDARLLTGQGTYVADFHLPDMLHAAILRSPLAHAALPPSRRMPQRRCRASQRC
jgi:carbon-monoxide dehydrogenase large subunit